MSKPVRQIIQVRDEGNRRSKTKIIGFCSGLVGELGQVILSPVDTPETVAGMANSGGIDGKNNDAGTLSLVNGSVHVRIGRATAVKSVDAIGDHKDLTTGLSLRPPLDQVSHREVGAGRRTRIPQRQAQRLSCLRMVSRQVLNNLYRSLTHITNANGGRSRLRADEFPQILQLRIQAVIGSIIDQQKKFQPGMVSL